MRRKWTDEQLIESLAKSETMSKVIESLGLVPAGGNYTQVKARIKELGLDTSHLSRGSHPSYRRSSRKDISEHLILNDYGKGISSYHLKTRLLAENLKPRQCEKCKLAEWNNKPIPLELHHINGNRHDNRIENLRILCPNCHAQTPNYRGSKVKSREPKSNQATVTNYCVDCGCGISPNAKKCNKCKGIEQRRVKRPPVADLRSEIDKHGYEATGRKYGVSGNAVRKWIQG